MIGLKDIGIIAGIVIPVLTGGIYVHDIDRKVIVLAQDYIGDQILRNQKETWAYQDQVKKNPNDEAAKQRLRELEYEKALLQEKKQNYKGGK
jgi:hypothetical protein